MITDKHHWWGGCAGAVLCVVGATSWLSPMYAQAQTPQERCQQETAAYNQVQKAAWQASHPGQEVPDPPPWPPYRCGGLPGGGSGPDAPGSGIPGGGLPGSGGVGDAAPSGGVGSAVRPHRLDQLSVGGADASSGRGWSDNGQSVGGPRQQISPVVPSGGSASQSARSNVRVPARAVQVIDGGQPRVVDVVDDGQGRGVVVDAYGVPTGEAVSSDGRGGYALVPQDADADKTPDGSKAASNSAQEDSVEHRPHEQEVPAKGAGGQKGMSDVMASSSFGGGGDAGVAGGAAAALVGAAVGAARRSRRGGPGAFGRVHEFGWVQPDGDVQRFMVVPDVSAPHEHRFDVEVPPGGEMVTNPDGSVDVVDSQGRVVDHVRRPWAFDAAGRPVKTWYEVDNQRGQLVQKVAPDQSVVYPIVADPEQDKSRVVKGSPHAAAGNVKRSAGAGSVSRQPMPGKSSSRAPVKKSPVREGMSPRGVAARAGKGTQVRPAAKPVVSRPASPKTASRGSASERARLDATVPARQPGFIGPVTAEDAAGQQRNKERIQVENKNATKNSINVAGAAADGFEREARKAQHGRHAKLGSGLAGESSKWASRASKASRPLFVANIAIETLDTAIEASNDTKNKWKHLGEGAGSVAGGFAGAYYGAQLGALGGPAAPVTIPMGVVAGAILGATGGGEIVGGAAGRWLDK